MSMSDVVEQAGERREEKDACFTCFNVFYSLRETPNVRCRFAVWTFELRTEDEEVLCFLHVCVLCLKVHTANLQRTFGVSRKL
jgi:hypothetical protein